MSERSLLRRSPNSWTVLVALALALLTIIAGVVFLLVLGLWGSHGPTESRLLMPEAEFTSRLLHVPAIVLLAVILLLLLPLLARYRRRARRTVPPQS